MSVHLVINFNVRNEKLLSFKEIMSTVKENLPTVPGCLNIEILQHIENPLQFTLIEQWDSEKTHQRHVEGLVSSGKWNFIIDHLQESPITGYCIKI